MIKGLNVDNSEFVLNQLADGTSLFLENNEKPFKTCVKLMDKFSILSGLKIDC
jgi:hypothetical protein